MMLNINSSKTEYITVSIYHLHKNQYYVNILSLLRFLLLYKITSKVLPALGSSVISKATVIDKLVTQFYPGHGVLHCQSQN